MPTAARGFRWSVAGLVLAVVAGLGSLPAGAQTTVPAPPRAIRPSLDCHSDTSTSADFNRDGVDDVAIAAPFDDLFNNGDAGSLNVVYGVADDGLDSLTDTFLSPASAGIPAFKWVFGAGRLFGKGMAAGDFNDDGTRILRWVHPARLPTASCNPEPCSSSTARGRHRHPLLAGPVPGPRVPVGQRDGRLLRLGRGSGRLRR